MKKKNDREGADFVVQQDGVESEEDDPFGDAAGAPAPANVNASWVGLSTKNQFLMDVKKVKTDKKAILLMKETAKAKTLAAWKGFVRERKVNEKRKANEDID